jgi:phasin family protein
MSTWGITNMATVKSESAAQMDGQRFIGAGLELMLTSQRRNVEAMMQMNRLTLDNVQQAWQRQLDFLEQAVEGFTSLASSLGGTDGPRQDRLAKHAEHSRQAFQTNLANARELTQLTAKAANDVINVISERFWGGLDELRRAQERRNLTGSGFDRPDQPSRS